LGLGKKKKSPVGYKMLSGPGHVLIHSWERGLPMTEEETYQKGCLYPRQVSKSGKTELTKKGRVPCVMLDTSKTGGN